MKLPEQTAGDYQDTGFCMYCLMTLEAKQPGGRDARHKSTQTPYNQCPQALKALKEKR
jgi:hypothetical protein